MTVKKVKSNNVKIGQRLRELRHRHKNKQSNMARILNISPAAYQKIETGINEISCKHILTIRDHFNISTDWLLSGETSIDSQDFAENKEDVKKMLADMMASKQVLFSMLSHYYEIIVKNEGINKKKNRILKIDDGE